MTVYEKALEEAREDKKVKADFKKKSLKVDNKYWIKEGRNLTDLELIIDNGEDKLQKIEELYHKYKFSYPDETSTKNSRKNYFLALDSEDMTMAELVKGENRELSRVELELYILLHALNKSFVWEEGFGSYFYQGSDKDLVIMREWVE